MMYDSGAQIPVWCAGKEVILVAYPDVRKTALSCTISGFGKEKDNGMFSNMIDVERELGVRCSYA